MKVIWGADGNGRYGVGIQPTKDGENIGITVVGRLESGRRPLPAPTGTMAGLTRTDLARLRTEIDHILQ